MPALAFLFLLLPQAAAPPTPQKPVPIEIELKKGSPEEARTRDQLLRLLKTHDLERWIFTRKIVIDGTPRLISHSHPVLTLSTEYLKDDELLLATFVHEQLHWYLEENQERARKAMEELRKLYPDAPSGPPWGARDLESTYRHLIVCYWEIRAAKELLGELRGFQVAQFWAHDHYMWVYRKVMEEGYKIGPVIHKHGLVPDARKGHGVGAAGGSSTGAAAASDRPPGGPLRGGGVLGPGGRHPCQVVKERDRPFPATVRPGPGSSRPGSWTAPPSPAAIRPDPVTVRPERRNARTDAGKIRPHAAAFCPGRWTLRSLGRTAASSGRDSRPSGRSVPGSRRISPGSGRTVRPFVGAARPPGRTVHGRGFLAALPACASDRLGERPDERVDVGQERE